jgi:hypothetical protein
MLSLALNLMLTGLFIFAVKQLTATLPAYRSPDPADAGF